MGKVLIGLLLFIILLVGCSIWNGGGSSNEYIVKLTKEAESVIQVFEEAGIKVLDKLTLIDAVLCKLKDSDIAFLKHLDIVEYIEPNGTAYALAAPEPQGLWEMLAGPTGGLRGLATGEVIPGGVKRVGANKVWDKTMGLDGVTLAPIKVAILDTGISSKVDDLAGKVVGGYNFYGNNDNWEDDNNHGTYIASVIGARRNGKGIVGVMPDTEFYAVKVLSSNGRGSYFTIIKGLEWISNNSEIELVNISLGGYSGSKAFKDAVLACAGQGIGCIASAGNDGKTDQGDHLVYPARFGLCISVGALEVSGARATFSNYGDMLKKSGVMAPGVYIPAYNKKGDIVNVSGTSLSAPHVTGAAVMLRAKKWCTRKFIFQGSDRYNSPDIYNGHGAINYPKILEALYHAAGSSVEDIEAARTSRNATVVDWR